MTQMLTNMVKFDMDVQDVLAAPRTSFVIPDVLAVERGISQPVLDDLVARGHNVRSATAASGNAHALAIEYDESGNPSASPAPIPAASAPPPGTERYWQRSKTQ